MEFSRQEYWSVLPFTSPGDLPEPGTVPESPALRAHSYSVSHQGNLLKLSCEQKLFLKNTYKRKKKVSLLQDYLQHDDAVNTKGAKQNDAPTL